MFCSIVALITCLSSCSISCLSSDGVTVSGVKAGPAHLQSQTPCYFTASVGGNLWQKKFNLCNAGIDGPEITEVNAKLGKPTCSGRHKRSKSIKFTVSTVCLSHPPYS